MYPYFGFRIGNNTTDKNINEISIKEKRIVITKDSDFFKSFSAKKEPFKLIFVKLGNTSKNDLLRFFSENLNQIISQIEEEEILLLTKK